MRYQLGILGTRLYIIIDSDKNKRTSHQLKVQDVFAMASSNNSLYWKPIYKEHPPIDFNIVAEADTLEELKLQVPWLFI